MSCSDKRGLKGTSDEGGPEPTPLPPTIIMEIDVETMVYVLALDLICMTNNAAEAYVVARGMADACKRFPIGADHSAEEARCVADSIGMRGLINVKVVDGGVSKRDVPQLVNNGKALLNTLQFINPRPADVRFVAEAIANVFERGLDKRPGKSPRYEKSVGAVAKELTCFMEERAEIMRKHGGSAVRNLASGPNPQENKMYG